jgi:glycosyltransferase involved in cell wall biosynthesis
MKILIIHSYYQLRGGEDGVVEQEIELLQQQHTVEFLGFQNQSGWKGAVQFLGSIWNKKAAKKVKDKITAFQPDVVHIHNWHFALGPLVFRVISSLGIPVVHTVHNYRLLCPSGILLHNGKLFTDSLKQSFPWKAVRNKVYRTSFKPFGWLLSFGFIRK